MWCIVYDLRAMTKFKEKRYLEKLGELNALRLFLNVYVIMKTAHYQRFINVCGYYFIHSLTSSLDVNKLWNE